MIPSDRAVLAADVAHADDYYSCKYWLGTFGYLALKNQHGLARRLNGPLQMKGC